MKFLRSAALAGSVLFTPVQPLLSAEGEPARLALVIGNRLYANQPEIASSETDAREVAKTLRAIGFDVAEPEINLATFKEFMDAVVDFRRKVRRGELIVIFYSGHGFAFGQYNFLAPTAMPREIEESKVARIAVPAEGIIGMFEHERPGLVLLILDACRSNASFVVRDKDGADRVRMGPAQSEKVVDGPPNYIMALSTRPGEAAVGFSVPGKPSIYTGVLTKHLDDQGVEFALSHQSVAAEVRIESDEAQDPGLINYSTAIFYLNPTDEIRRQEDVAWKAALESGDRKIIRLYALQYALSRNAAAAEAWLDRNPEAKRAPAFTQVSPAAADRAWDPGSKAPVMVDRFSGSIAVERRVVLPAARPREGATEAPATYPPRDMPVSEPTSALPPTPSVPDVVVSPITPRSADDVSRAPASIDTAADSAPDVRSVILNSAGYIPAGIGTGAPDTALSIDVEATSPDTVRSVFAATPHTEVEGALLTTASTSVRTRPERTAPALAVLKPRTRLEIVELVDGLDGTGIWAMLALDPSDPDRMGYIPFDASPATSIALGRSLVEVSLPPVLGGIPTLVDATLLEREMAALKARHRRVTWASLAVAPSRDPREVDMRVARLAHAMLLLRNAGIDARRVTSVVGVDDYAGDGVRVRLYGH
jgi:uncharacterized caspase-like protein